MPRQAKVQHLDTIFVVSFTCYARGAEAWHTRYAQHPHTRYHYQYRSSTELSGRNQSSVLHRTYRLPNSTTTTMRRLKMDGVERAERPRGLTTRTHRRLQDDALTHHMHDHHKLASGEPLSSRHASAPTSAYSVCACVWLCG